jgi:hypothetical protein
VQVNELLVWQIPPLSVRLGQLTSVLSTFIGFMSWSMSFLHFLVSLILVIQWRTKPVVVTKQIGSSVNFNSEYHFQVAPSRPDTCWHFQAISTSCNHQ